MNNINPMNNNIYFNGNDTLLNTSNNIYGNTSEIFGRFRTKIVNHIK